MTTPIMRTKGPQCSGASVTVSPSLSTASGLKPEHPRQLVEQHGGHSDRGQREEQGPWQPEEEDERGGQCGSEGEAGVAADGEEAHPAGPARPGDVVGEPRRLRVERGHPDTTQLRRRAGSGDS